MLESKKVSSQTSWFWRWFPAAAMWPRSNPLYCKILNTVSYITNIQKYIQLCYVRKGCVLDNKFLLCNLRSLTWRRGAWRHPRERWTSGGRHCHFGQRNFGWGARRPNAAPDSAGRRIPHNLWKYSDYFCRNQKIRPLRRRVATHWWENPKQRLLLCRSILVILEVLIPLIVEIGIFLRVCWKKSASFCRFLFIRSWSHYAASKRPNKHGWQRQNFPSIHTYIHKIAFSQTNAHMRS